MRKFLIVFCVIFSCCLLCPVQNSYGEDSDGTSWNDLMKFDQSWRDNHKPVTDEEFEKVMQKYEKKKKPKKYEFEADETRDSLNDMSILKDIANHSPTILFPANLRSYEGEYIPAGYYKLNYVEKDKKHYLIISQGRNIFAKLKMKQTSENFGLDSIQFAEIRPYNDEMMKLIYGNLDLNLEKTLYIIH